MSRNILDWRTVSAASFAVSFGYPGDLSAFALALLGARLPWIQSWDRNDRLGTYLVLRPLGDALGVVRILPRDGGFVANASVRRLPGEPGQGLSEEGLAALVSRAGGLSVARTASLESGLANPRLETMRLGVYRTRSAGSSSGALPLPFAGEVTELAARVQAISAWSWSKHVTYVSAPVLPPPHAGYLQLVCAEAPRAAWYLEAVSTSDTPCAPARGKLLVEAAQREVITLIERLSVGKAGA